MIKSFIFLGCVAFFLGCSNDRGTTPEQASTNNSFYLGEWCTSRTFSNSNDSDYIELTIKPTGVATTLWWKGTKASAVALDTDLWADTGNYSVASNFLLNVDFKNDGKAVLLLQQCHNKDSLWVGWTKRPYLPFYRISGSTGRLSGASFYKTPQSWTNDTGRIVYEHIMLEFLNDSQFIEHRGSTFTSVMPTLLPSDTLLYTDRSGELVLDGDSCLYHLSNDTLHIGALFKFRRKS